MKKWIVKLICCGRDDGIYQADTWEEADSFRESYTSGPYVNVPGGHERAGIVEKSMLTESLEG